MKHQPPIPKKFTFDGVHYKLLKSNIGSGAQGSVHLVCKSDNPAQKAIVKSLPNDPDILKRTQYLIDQGLGYELPFVSAPLAMTKIKKGKQQSIFYLSTFVEGVSLENDVARPLTDLLLMAYQGVCSWEQLERRSIAHGDASFTNFMVSPNRTIHMIDTDNFMAFGTSIPRPKMYGQHPVMAPELRQAERDKRAPIIDLTTDRFAWAAVLSYQILQRHPASWITGGPAALDSAMMLGRWPERKRNHDLAINALGPNLPILFDKGFSRSALERPDAATWKQALQEAILSLHVHGCGTAFVHDVTRNRCPKCGKKIPVPILYQTTATGVPAITFEHIGSGKKASFPLNEGQFGFVGRKNLPNASGYVSGQHLQFYRHGPMLYITHIGTNPTTLELANSSEKYALTELKEPLRNGRISNAILTLGDTHYRISITSM